MDDIINRVATNDINELRFTTEEMYEVIKKQLAMINVFLNNNKAQSIWRYHGEGSVAAKVQLYTEQLHGIDDHIRYLGLQLEEGGRCQVGVTIRIQEAQVAWDHCKGF